jgi:hypothetical protein
MAGAETYYVSNAGADEREGKTPETAWQTLDRANSAALAPGDSVLFRRGDAWRGQLRPCSGDETAPIRYAAYGTGDKPALIGSIPKGRAEDWIDEGNNVWRTREPAASGGVLTADVGNIIFDGEKSCGVKVWKPEDLNAQDRFWYDEARHVLKVYSTANPAAAHAIIECALREHIIDQSARSHVEYEGLALKYGAAHGIGGGSTHHITVRDCDLSYIGGGDQMGGGKTVRFGNGIEFWGSAHDCLVEGCRLWEIYDAALTNQSSGPVTPQYNIVYRNNVIWNSEYSFEYWNRPEASETYNVRFEHNTCFNAGSGWGHAQRPDPSGRHLCFYTSPARAHDIAIRDNVFCGALGNAFYAPTWTREAIDALDMDRNCWRQPEGDMISIAQQRYAMSAFAGYQKEFNKEPHSLAADPGVVDAANHDYRLRPDSPCRTGNETIGADGKIHEVNVRHVATH